MVNCLVTLLGIFALFPLAHFLWHVPEHGGSRPMHPSGEKTAIKPSNYSIIKKIKMQYLKASCKKFCIEHKKL